MLKKIFITALVFTLLAAAATAADERKRIAVLDFEFGTVQRWWDGNWDIGRGLSDLLVNELVTDGSYRLIERNRLDAVLGEQDFNNSDRANATTASRIGRVLGVNAIIVGSITQFGTEERETGIGAVAGRLGRFGGARVGTSKGKAKVAIDARVVDIETGEILAVAKGVGESSRSGLLLGGLGGGRGGFGAAQIDMSSSDFRETILGEAVYAAVQQLGRGLIDVEPNIPYRKIEVQGLIADVAGSSLTLDVGSNHGVGVGDTLAILRVTRVVKHPVTGSVLREITEEIGRVRIVEVGEDYSVGTVVSGQDIQVGDLVRSTG